MYGDHRLRLDPQVLNPQPPTEGELHAWLTEPQAQSYPPLTVGELMVEQALTEFEMAALADDTRQMEVARG